MMPRKGEVRVPVRVSDIRELANWLDRVGIPEACKRPDTLLTPGHQAEQIVWLEALAKTLRKAAVRKLSSAAFEMRLPKTEVGAIISSLSSRSRFLTFPLRRVFVAAKKTYFAREGRPPLSRPQMTVQLSRRVVEDQDNTDRHRWRLDARLRRARETDEWLNAVQQRGETLLGTELAPPKI